MARSGDEMKPPRGLREATKAAANVTRLAPSKVVRGPTLVTETLATEMGASGAPQPMETMMQQANKAAESFFKAAEEAAEFSRGNVEAMAKAAQLYVTGVQDLGKQTLALMQGLTDHALEGAKALAAVKSLQEAAQIQANYTRAAFERSVSESSRLGESALKLAEQAAAPITARVTLAVEKLARPQLAA